MENKDRKEETRKRCRRRDADGPAPTDVVSAGTTSDDEVEEFFAIIRRMHLAARMMSRAPKPSTAAEGEETKKTGAIKWQPAFRLEDFGEEEEDGEVRKLGSSKEERPMVVLKKKKGIGGGGFGLDLNAEPEPEPEPEPEGVPG